MHVVVNVSVVAVRCGASTVMTSALSVTRQRFASGVLDDLARSRGGACHE